MTTRVRISKHQPGVYLGTLTIGCPDSGGVGDSYGDAAITVGAFGSSQADALHKASMIAERIADDPVLRAILPPQAAAAILATKKLAAAAKHGRQALSSLWGSLRGKGKKRLAKALAKEQDDESQDGVGFLPLAIIAAKYGPTAVKLVQRHGPGALKAIKRMRKKQRARGPMRASRPARRPAPVDDAYATPTDDDVMNTPPHEDITPIPEDALGPMGYPGDDQGDDYDEGA